jgi:hypothetical protein
MCSQFSEVACSLYILALLLKARIVKPAETAFARELLGKHIISATTVT